MSGLGIDQAELTEKNPFRRVFVRLLHFSPMQLLPVAELLRSGMVAGSV